MERKFIKILQEWDKNQIKEPMMVIGARQVGKTWIVREYLENNYSEYIYINLEEQPELISAFEGNLSPDNILRNLSILLGKDIDFKIPIFIDEIQQSERAITSLKYFCEAKENYRVIVAGSLLGVKINRFQTSFPVGKVQIVHMYPMDFEEFLLACGEEKLRDMIKEAYDTMSPIPSGIHEKALNLYHDYLVVGGMPQMVVNFVDNGKNIMKANRNLLDFLRLAYLADMSKYVNNAPETAKITAIYESIPRQLARENPKFKYKDVSANAVKRDYYTPIDWLVSSDMIIKLNRLESPNLPLKGYENPDSFKIYLSDVGLLSSICQLGVRELLSDTNNIYKGAVIENYVIEQLRCNKKDLYYYKPTESMEIDLIIEIDDEIIPIEIKSGRHKRSVSLDNYRKKYNPSYAIRFSENQFGYTNQIKSVPLYAVFCI